MQLIQDYPDMKIFRIKPSTKLKSANLDLFLAKTMSYSIQTLCNEKQALQFAVAVRIRFKNHGIDEMQSFDSECCPYNEGDVLTDCFQLHRELEAKFETYKQDETSCCFDEIIDYQLKILYSEKELCEGCRINHPSQLQHMGVNGCLNSDSFL